MASGDSQSPLRNINASSSSSSRNDGEESQWMLLPNNLEISTRSKPSKKQRNKEKQGRPDNLILPPNAADGFSSNPTDYQNFPRSKSGSTSWPKEQYMSDQSRQRAYEPEEVFSDTDLHSNFHTIYSIDPTEYPEQQSGILEENENVNSNKEESVKSEITMEEFSRIQEAMKHVTDKEKEHKVLLQQMSAAFNNDHSNKSNHIRERMKQSEERLMTLKKQASSSYQIQKKADNKLPYSVFANVPLYDSANIEPERSSPDQPQHGLGEQTHPSFWKDATAQDSQDQHWIDSKHLQKPFEADESPSGSWQDPQAIRKLHKSLERIEKQVEFVQQNLNAQSVNSNESEIRQRVALVERERKKLKNKLLEIQEKKLMNDKLLQELDRESCNASQKACYVENDANNAGASTRSNQSVRPKEKKNLHSGTHIKRDNVRKDIPGFPARRHYEAEGRANEDVDIPTATISSQPPPTLNKCTPGTQDKIRKLQMAQKQVKDAMASFEEAKMSRKSVSLEQLHMSVYEQEENDIEHFTSSSESDYEVTDKKVQPIENAMQVKEVEQTRRISQHSSEVESLDAQTNALLMRQIRLIAQERGEPLNYLHMLANLHSNQGEEIDYSSDEDQNTLPNKSSKKISAIHLKNISGTSQLPDNIECDNSAVPYKLELATGERKDDGCINELNQPAQESSTDRKGLAMNKKEFDVLKSRLDASIDFLMQQSFDKKNDDVRSSGEGGLIQNQDNSRNSGECNVPTVAFCNPQSSFKLTRQNIATMESQNQNCKKNLHNAACAVKKDINLACKMGKLRIQNAVSTFPQIPISSKGILDSVSTASSEMNQSRTSERDKKALPNIQKRRNRKPKACLVNHQNPINGHSSFDSEPLENFNSALIGHRTVADAWGSLYPEEIGGTDKMTKMPANPSMDYNAPPRAEGFSKVKSDSTFVQAQQSNESPSRSTTSVKGHPTPKSSHFLQQLKRHIGQINSLCQEELQHEESQNFNSGQQNMGSNKSNTCQTCQTSSDSQLHNQQLLLCLSQCCQTLYLQQLEIQRLQGCIRQNVDADVNQQANNVNRGNNSEDLRFSPWCMCPGANPIMPSNFYHHSQISPPRPTPYMPFLLKKCTLHNGSDSGIQQRETMIPPINQDNRSAQEILNNQVPPRTRANNFWDNFRSYSHQNLLSTSNNIKRNEVDGFGIPAHVGQVHPLIPNEANQEPGMAFPISEFDRSMLNFDRSVPSPFFYGMGNKSKKPNTSMTVAPNQQPSSSFTFKSRLLNVPETSSNVQSLEHTQDTSFDNKTPVNIAGLQTCEDRSKISNFSSTSPTTLTNSGVRLHTLPGSRVLQRDLDFLSGIYHEAQALKSVDQRQQVLNVIRDIAQAGKDTERENVIQDCVQDECLGSLNREEATSELLTYYQPVAVSTNDINPFQSGDGNTFTGRIAPEGYEPRMNQDVSTAAISPLNTGIIPSTGAVRKKPQLNQSTQFWEDLLSEETSSYNIENVEIKGLVESTPDSGDLTNETLHQIMRDLLNYMRKQTNVSTSNSFWMSVNEFIINTVRSCLGTVPHKALASLRHTLDDSVPSLFSGMRYVECQAEFLEYISELLHDSLVCFFQTGRFAPSPQYAMHNSMSARADNKELLAVKMPPEPAKVQAENSTLTNVYPPQFRAILEQNLLLNAGCNINPVQPEEASGYEWVLEPEIEPEAEAGTEADLAEADQSPGQQGNASNATAPATAADSSEQEPNSSRNVSTLNEVEQCANAEMGAVSNDGSIANGEPQRDEVSSSLTDEDAEKVECQNETNNSAL